MIKKYYIGLDIGTTSCGYAVTDENYNILKVKGKKAWGVKIFDEANVAEERRIKRGNRRRLDRRKLKLEWLKEIFADEIRKIDKDFFTRLKYSNLRMEDKIKGNLHSKNSLFNDCKNKYDDKCFYNDYPTIYHLRKDLTVNPAKDVRLLYLAIHNIIKRRGHFLYEGEMGENENIKTQINNSISVLKNYYHDTISDFYLNEIDETKENQILQIIKSNKVVKERKKDLQIIFNANDKTSKKIVEIFIDGKVKIKDLFGIETNEKFAFDDENYENAVLPNLERILSEEELQIVEKLKQVYTTLQLKKVLGNHNYLCEAMVDIYEKHNKQLQKFKTFIKTFYPNFYYEIFRNNQSQNSNYVKYVNGGIVNNIKQVLNTSNRDKDNFYKFIKKVLEDKPKLNEHNQENYYKEKEDIINLIENNEFLIKQRSKANSIFPNKLYVKELERILNINSERFPFLMAKDETGLTNVEKILQILQFRIPYFVGPIGKNENSESNFGWCERKSDRALRPWNLEEVIDLDKSEENFIVKMINHCSYLPNEEVLPKKSILYSKFSVLNELNNLKINGNEISVELKQNIFNNVFKQNKNVTIKHLKDYLVAQGLFSKNEIKEVQITGIDKDFANNYSTYINFVNILGKDFVEKNSNIIEKVIKYHTIISDKKRLKKRLKKEFGNIFNDETLGKIISLTFSDWGRLSGKFLSGLKFVNLETGEVTTIIDQLWETNKNLQEILFDKNYTLYKELEKKNKDVLKEITYQDVNDLYCSPAVKRGVWQTIKIVNEIISLMGCQPEKVFVEVTRKDEKKGDEGRKVSRKENLLKLYNSADFKKSIKNLNIEINDLINGLNEKENNAFRSDRLYLYYLQLGKCIYSGNPIDIEKIYNENYYDIDHILPQSLIKDDSINNRVLVENNYNKTKKDVYPINIDWINKQKPFWELLVKLKLMDKSKFEKLTRTSELTDDDRGKFIARQLVETNQSVLAVIDLLKRLVDNPRKIVYSKARFVTMFRKKYDIPKCREVNNLHHAKDAYLNVVVGNVLFNRFTEDPRNFYKKNNNKDTTKNINKLFDGVVKNFNKDVVVWNGNESVQKVKEICSKNDCIVSFMNYSNLNGAFYDETIYKSLKNDPKSKAKISLKGDEKNPLNNVEYYGGYNNMSSAYFMVVESEDKKGNKIKTIETVPIYIIRKYKDYKDKDAKIFEYVVKENGLKNAKILINKLNIKSTLLIDNGKYLLAGKTGSQYVLHNANEWFVDDETMNYVKAISKYISLKSENKVSELEEINKKVVVSKASKEGNKEIALTEEENLKLYKTIIGQLDKKVYENSTLAETLNSKLKEKFDVFKSLSVLEQAELLYRVILRIAPGATLADLSLLKEGASSGKILIGKNITNKKFKLLLQSDAGLLSKKIAL